MTRASIIGQPLPRHDALGKVTGDTRYPGDLFAPGTLHLKVVYAGRPHARILGIETTEALAVPGVVAVLTAADVPYNAFGLIDHDQPVLCGDVVRFAGDKVAVVVAETNDAAETGAAKVSVSFEDLPAVTDPRAALEADAVLVHEMRGTNLLLRVPIRKGDVDAGFAAADVVLDG
jgi:CO/xanthine dehydrogenase Mo-binding subunit